MTPDELAEVEAIKQVKYRYLRAVDTRDWDLLESTLSEEATAAYSGGKLSFEGRDAIIGFLSESMPERDVLSAHRVHHPEIELTGPATATARWALDDVVIVVPTELTIRGAAYYEDRMEKVDGRWRIAHTGYRRLYEETSRREGINLTDSWWPSGLSPGHHGVKLPNPPR